MLLNCSKECLDNLIQVYYNIEKKPDKIYSKIEYSIIKSKIKIKSSPIYKKKQLDIKCTGTE